MYSQYVFRYLESFIECRFFLGLSDTEHGAFRLHVLFF
jgi:hypothetical protein